MSDSICIHSGKGYKQLDNCIARSQWFLHHADRSKLNLEKILTKYDILCFFPIRWNKMVPWLKQHLHRLQTYFGKSVFFGCKHSFTWLKPEKKILGVYTFCYFTQPFPSYRHLCCRRLLKHWDKRRNRLKWAINPFARFFFKFFSLIVPFFANIFSKSSVSDSLYMGKG